MREGHGDHKLRLIRCGCRKIEEVMRLKLIDDGRHQLMIEDLIEGSRWIKYLIKHFCG